MDFFDLVFGSGQAIQGIFKLGFIPKEEDFREFSSLEYQKFKEKECYICGTMYTFKSGLPIAENDVYVVSRKVSTSSKLNVIFLLPRPAIVVEKYIKVYS